MACVGIVAYEVHVELDAAVTAPAPAPAAMAHARAASVLHDQAVAAAKAASQEIKPAEADSGEGRQAKLQREQNAGAALGLTKSRDEEAKKLRDQELANAKKVPAGEADLMQELAWIGAFGSASLLPLLGFYLAARRRVRP